MTDRLDSQAFDLIEGGQPTDLFATSVSTSVSIDDEALATEKKITKEELKAYTVGMNLPLSKDDVLEAIEAVFKGGYTFNKEGEAMHLFSSEEEERSAYSILDSLLTLPEAAKKKFSLPPPDIHLYTGEEMLEATSEGGVRYKEYRDPSEEHAWYYPSQNLSWNINYTDQYWWKEDEKRTVSFPYKTRPKMHATDLNSILAELSHYYQDYNPDWREEETWVTEVPQPAQRERHGNWSDWNLRHSEAETFYEKYKHGYIRTKKFKNYPWSDKRVDVPDVPGNTVRDWMLDENGQIESWRLNYNIPGAHEFEAHKVIEKELRDLFYKVGFDWQMMEYNIKENKIKGILEDFKNE